MNSYLKHIDIKNFKCFKDFKVEGLARVNLITGQNNVGKTAFLEAAHIHTAAQTLPLFFASFCGVKCYHFKFNNQEIDVNSNDFSHQNFNELKQKLTTLFN